MTMFSFIEPLPISLLSSRYSLSIYCLHSGVQWRFQTKKNAPIKLILHQSCNSMFWSKTLQLFMVCLLFHSSHRVQILWNLLLESEPSHFSHLTSTPWSRLPLLQETFHHCSTQNPPEFLSYLNKILKSLMRSHILVHGYFSACFWLPSLLKGSHPNSLPVSLRANTDRLVAQSSLQVTPLLPPRCHAPSLR